MTTCRRPFLCVQGRAGPGHMMEHGQEICDGQKSLLVIQHVKGQTRERRNHHISSSRGLVSRSRPLYELYCPKLQKHGSTEDPLYSLYCSTHIYVYHRNRRDFFGLFFKTQEGKHTVLRSIFSGNWISRLTKEEKVLKRTNF